MRFSPRSAVLSSPSLATTHISEPSFQPYRLQMRADARHAPCLCLYLFTRGALMITAAACSFALRVQERCARRHERYGSVRFRLPRYAARRVFTRRKHAPAPRGSSSAKRCFRQCHEGVPRKIRLMLATPQEACAREADAVASVYDKRCAMALLICA